MTTPEPQFTAEMARAAMARLREEAAYNHPVRLEKERLQREAKEHMLALLADYCLAVAREAGDRRVRYCDMTEELREAH